MICKCFCAVESGSGCFRLKHSSFKACFSVWSILSMGGLGDVFNAPPSSWQGAVVTATLGSYERLDLSPDKLFQPCSFLRFLGFQWHPVRNRRIVFPFLFFNLNCTDTSSFHCISFLNFFFTCHTFATSTRGSITETEISPGPKRFNMCHWITFYGWCSFL